MRADQHGRAGQHGRADQHGDTKSRSIHGELPELRKCAELLCKHRIHRMGTEYTETTELLFIYC